MNIKEIITKFGFYTAILLIFSVLILAQISLAEDSSKVIESKNTSIDGVLIESVKMSGAYLDTPIIYLERDNTNNFSKSSINSVASSAITIEQKQNIDNRIKEKKAKIDSNLIRFKSGYNILTNLTVENTISSQSLSATVPETATEYYLIQFNDSLNYVDVETRNELQNSGVVLMNYVPNNAFYAKIPAAALNNIRYLIDNGKIKYVGQIPPQAKISQQFLLEVQENPDTFTDIVVYLFDEPTEAEIKILSNYMEIDSYSNITYFVYGSASANNITNIYSLEFVKYIEKSLPVTAFNNDATSGVANDIVQYTGYTGSGVRVAVADSGIAQDDSGITLHGSNFHPDLIGSRIADQQDFKFLASDDDIAEDENGHGTHVAGTIGGSGLKSDGKNRGMAPDVTFLIYRFLDANGNGEAYQFDPIAERAAENHADIISNSWGSVGDYGNYNSNSEIADKLVRGEYTDSTISNLLGNPQRMNVVIAAGNDNNYVTPPGTAKNAITVGAAKDGNFAPITLSWLVCSDNNWPQGQTVCFSNHGPLDGDNDGYARVKPDVIAPGVIINSTAPWYPYNLYNPSNLRGYYYGIMSGTSMATPVVSGAIANLLEAYPSVKGWPEMVKARVINTAISAGNPQIREGHGMIDSYHMIYSDTTFHNLKWIGDSVDTSDPLKTYYFDVPNNFKEVKVTLTWSDPAGSSEVTNDLDLYIYDANGALISWSDSYDDTVEQTTASAGTPGQWRAEVSATTLNDGPQRFGLSASAVLVEPSLNLISSVDKTSIGPDEMLKVTTDISNSGYTALGSYISIEVPNGMLVDSAYMYRTDGVKFNYPLSEIYHVPYTGGERYYLAVGELINGYSRKVDWNIRSNSNIANGSYTISVDGAARNTVSSPSTSIVVNVGTTANTQTTTGTVSETHSCDSISVAATYSGDSNNDGSATLYYKLSSSPSWIIYGSMTKGTNQYTRTISGLLENRNYDVEVRYSDPDGIVGSATISKSLINTGLCAGSPPSIPTLIDPGTTDTNGEYLVDWSYHNDATYYRLEESTSSSFSNPTIYTLDVDLQLVTGKGNGLYYYRVQACNNYGCSDWSNIESITVNLGLISDNSYAGNIYYGGMIDSSTTVTDYSHDIYTVKVIDRYYSNNPAQVRAEIYKDGNKITTATLDAHTAYYFDSYNLQIFVAEAHYFNPGYMEFIAINTKTTSSEVDATPSVISLTSGSSGSTYFKIPTLSSGAYDDFYIGGNAKDWVTNPPIKTPGAETNELSYSGATSTNIDITVPSATMPGTYTLYVLATPGYGVENNVGAPVYSVKEVQINVEPPNSPPTASIDSILPNPSIQGQTTSFSGHGSDSDGTIADWNWRSSIDGQLSTSESFSTSSLSAGTHIIYFKVEDNDDEWSNEVSQTLIVDLPNSFPTASITSITPNPSVQEQTVSFTGHGVDSDGTIIGWNWRSDINGQLSTSTSFSTSSLNVGTHTIYFKVEDNSNAWSDEVSQTLIISDITPPTITIDSPMDGAIFGESPVYISGIAKDNIGMRNVFINGNPANIYQITADGHYFDGWVDLNKGDNTITVSATDLAGNSNSTNLNVKLERHFNLSGNVNILWNTTLTGDSVDPFNVQDITGDSIPDILVYAYSILTNSENLSLYSGTDGNEVWTTPLFDQQNSNYFDFSNAGDLDGNGINDLIVIGHYFDDLSQQYQYSMKALSGTNGNELWQTSGLNLDTRPTTIGDINTNAHDDIAMIENNYSATNSYLKLSVIDGIDGIPIWSYTEYYTSNSWAYAEPSGDLDRDDVSDFIIFEEDYYNDNSQLTAISGKTGAVIFSKPLTDDYQTISDADGDGFTDIIVSVGSQVAAIRGYDASQLWVANGELAGVIDDIDGDGFEDVLVSEPDIFGQYQLITLNGNTGEVIWTKSTTSIEPFNYIFLMGDENGDGVTDFIAQSNWYNQYGSINYYRFDGISGLDGSILWNKEYGKYNGGLYPEAILDMGNDGTHYIVFNEYSWDSQSGSQMDNWIAVRAINGEVLWNFSKTYDYSTGYWYWPTFADFDNDGIFDVLDTGYDVPLNNPVTTSTIAAADSTSSLDVSSVSISQVKSTIPSGAYSLRTRGKYLADRNLFSNQQKPDGLASVNIASTSNIVQINSSSDTSSSGDVYYNSYAQMFSGNSIDAIIWNVSSNAIILPMINEYWYYDYSPVESSYGHIDLDSDGSSEIVLINGDELYALTVNTPYADTVAPSITFTSYTNNSVVNTSTIIITGNAYDATSVVWVKVNDVLVTGTTSWSSEITLTEGSNIITVTAADNAGNIGSSTITIVLDSTAPVISIDPVTTPTNASSQTITGTFTESGSGIASILVSGIPASISGSTYSADIVLSEGTNTISIVATDNAGNQNVETITVYLVPLPTESISIGSATAALNSTVSIPVSLAYTENITGFSFDLVYNSSVTTVSSVSANANFTGASITPNIDNINGNTRVILTGSDLITVSSKTPVIDIIFDITGGSGSSTSLVLQNVEFSDSEFNPYVPNSIVNGNITVGIKGDFNNNGRVDIGDVAKVAFMVAGMVPEELSADFNNNGYVDIGDAAKIAFYLAGKVSEL